jgi:hypothetical protein
MKAGITMLLISIALSTFAQQATEVGRYKLRPKQCSQDTVFMKNRIHKNNPAERLDHHGNKRRHDAPAPVNKRYRGHRQKGCTRSRERQMENRRGETYR